MKFSPSTPNLRIRAFAGPIVLTGLITLGLLSNVAPDSTAVNPCVETVVSSQFPSYENSETFTSSDAKRQFVHQWLELLLNRDRSKRNYSEAKKVISPTEWKKLGVLTSQAQMTTYVVSHEYCFDNHEVSAFPTLVGLTAENPYLPLHLEFAVSESRGSYWIESIKLEHSEGQEWQDASHAIREFYHSDTGLEISNEASKQYFLAQSLLAKFDRQGAIDAYSRAIKASPKFFLAYFCRGYERSVMGDHDGAIEDYSSALTINPKFIAAYHNRGYELNGFKKKHLEAYEDFCEVVRLAPNLASGYAYRARALNALSRYEEAIRDCNEAIRLSPRTGEAFAQRAFANTKLGDKLCAINDATKAIEFYEGSAWLYTLRGNANLAISRKVDAMNDYESAIRIDPNFGRAYSCRGHLRSLNGDHKGAIKDHNLAVYLDPRSADRYFIRGQSFASMGNFKSALADFEKCLDMEPKNVQFLKRRALSLLATDRVAEAKDALDKAISFVPDSVELRYHYYYRARANWRLRNFGDALADYAQYQKMTWYRPQGQRKLPDVYCRKHGFLDATSVAILIPTLVLLALIIAVAHKKRLFPWQDPMSEAESISGACKHCGHK